MSVAKIIEVNAASKTSMEDAVKVGLKKTSETVKNIKGAWVNEIKVAILDRPRHADAIEEILKPGCIIERNDAPVRKAEGLELHTAILRGPRMAPSQ